MSRFALILAAVLPLSAAVTFIGDEAPTQAPQVEQMASAPMSVELATASAPIEQGEASFYGAELAGNPTASGEPFDPSAMTAAHPTLPLGTMLRVTNDANGESVDVRINDRGPFAKDRILDLSRGAAEEIGMLASGHAQVSLYRL